MRKKHIILTCGEPAGIGCEIITKALHEYVGDSHFIIMGDKNHFFDVMPQNIAIDFYHYDFKMPIIMGQAQSNYADIVLQIIRDAVALCLKNPADYAMVTAPVQKDTLALYDNKFTGHTDFIADVIFDIQGVYYKPIMMLTSPELRVVPLTVHIPVVNIVKHLTFDHFAKTVQIIHDDLSQKYGLDNPHIAVAGLNPHAGDNGVMGHEEIDKINPWINQLKSKYNISGTYAADTLFHATARKNYDVALCMYHDQALIPIKTIAFDVGVNVTLGLPIVRTSPDHGTALNIAGKNIANPSAMLCAIYEAEKLISVPFICSQFD